MRLRRELAGAIRVPRNSATTSTWNDAFEMGPHSPRRVLAALRIAAGWRSRFFEDSGTAATRTVHSREMIVHADAHQFPAHSLTIINNLKQLRSGWGGEPENRPCTRLIQPGAIRGTTGAAIPDKNVRHPTPRRAEIGRIPASAPNLPAGCTAVPSSSVHGIW